MLAWGHPWLRGIRMATRAVYGFGVGILGLVTGALLACGTSSNPAAPAVGGVLIERTGLGPGSVAVVNVQLFLDAVEGASGVKESRPFSLVVRAPQGIQYVSNSAHVVFQPNREPNAQGACPDGTQYLLFDFEKGEFNNQFDLSDFSVSVLLNFVTQPVADKGRVGASASPLPPADPCAVDQTEYAVLRVSETPASRVPTPTLPPRAP